MAVGITVLTPNLEKDLSVSFNEDESGSDLLAAIRSGVGDPNIARLRIARTGVEVTASMRLGDLGLLHGDILDARPSAAASLEARLVRVGQCGPASVEVPRTGLRVGRAQQANDLVLDDDTVSKVHAVVSVAGTRLFIEDLGSTNGTVVGGTKLNSPKALHDGDMIEFGDRSQFRVEVKDAQPATVGPQWRRLGDHLQQSSGHLYVSRPWRQVKPRPTATYEIDAAPDPVASRKFPLPMVVLPVVVGVAGVFLFGSVNFLLFAALGPLMAGWNWYDSRRSGVAQFNEAKARYLARVDEVRAAAAASRDQLGDWLRWAYPTSTELCNRAFELAPSIWDRHASHPDAHDVRIGLGTMPVAGRIRISERGATDLVGEAATLRDEHRSDSNTPVSVRLTEMNVLSLVGDSERTRALARSIVVQLAVRNSPNDVRIATLGGTWSWARWLPHTQGEDAPPLVGTDTGSASRVLKVIDDRISRARQGDAPAERLVLVIEAPVAVDPSRLNAVLAGAAAAGVSVVWIADASGPPPESRAVVTIGTHSSLQMGDASAIPLTDVEAVDEATASAVARSLAPLIDPGSSTEGAVPDRVGLFEVLDRSLGSSASVLDRWRRPYEPELFAPIGIGKDGVITLDLSEKGDGPNGLVGGTVGAGKSEFLQTLILSLAANYGPDRLNFLFVDFKGGATFEPLLTLPHVVGMIRNLDGELAMRAQRSLKAEVRRRQALLPQHGVGKMSELWQRDPDAAMPALVVIIDEYAELAQNLPEFLDAVVQMAQTGRALGLHLLLATQAPGQSVSKLIQNCVKYRISFRLKDRNESIEVLGRGADASTLPNRPGRGYLVDGDARLHEFQAAYAGGHSIGDDEQASAVTLYTPSKRTADGGPTDLVVLRDAILGAGTAAGYPPPRKPWQDPLPRVIDLAALGRQGGRPFTLGRIDLPDQQAQPVFQWDTAKTPNLLAVGDAQTGKTSLLRTIAALTIDLPDVELIGIDAAGGGLVSIDGLPHVRGVVPAHDAAAIRRVVAHLQREAAARREALGRSGSLRELRASGGADLPDLIVLIDGLSALFDSMEMLDGTQPLETLKRLIVEGAPLGIHFVMATDQPHRVPMDIRNAARCRLVFRLGSRDAASAAEVSRSLADLPEGRAFSPSEGGDVQIAVLVDSGSSDGMAQARALDHFAQSSARLKAPPLPTPRAEVVPADLGAPLLERAAVLGLDDLAWEPVTLDFTQTPTLAVAGLDSSGRTTVIRWIRTSLAHSLPTMQSLYVAGREAPSDADLWTHVITSLRSELETLETYAAQIQERGRLDNPLLIALDDADDLFANPIGAPPEEVQTLKRLSAAMDVFVKAGRSSGVTLVLAGRLSGIGSGARWASAFRQNGQALVLAPGSLDGGGTDAVFQVPLPRRTGYRPTPGSAVLLRRGTPPTVVQLVRC